jgi:hypothetical protein
MATSSIRDKGVFTAQCLPRCCLLGGKPDFILLGRIQGNDTWPSNTLDSMMLSRSFLGLRG